MANLTIHSKRTICAAHFLKNYEGNCGNIHGHNWDIEVWITKKSVSKVDEVYFGKTEGMLFDFRAVKEICERLDHKQLNDLLDFNSTAENLSIYITKEIVNKFSVMERQGGLIVKTRVCEKGENWSEYSLDSDELRDEKE